MLGTWRWNVGFGLFGMILTVAFSISSNLLSVTLIRSVYAFIAFFALAYIVRAVLAILLQPPAIIGEAVEENESKGTQLDLKTPDETDDLNELLKTQLHNGANPVSNSSNDGADASSAFRPLSPPQLVSTKNTQPEELVKAIRHLTGE